MSDGNQKSTVARMEQEGKLGKKNNNNKFGETARPDNVEKGRFYSKWKTIL